MKFDEYEPKNNNNGFNIDINLYSNSKPDEAFEDIYSSTEQKPRSHAAAPKRKKRKSKAKRLRNALIIVICVLIGIIGAFYGYAHNTISNMENTPLDESDLGIDTSVYDDVRNIALLGVDSRKDNNSGRSDAVMIITVDKKHDKIKMSSIARDTYVSIDGHGKDKLTHAYAFGKSQLAVKTLNQNFDAEIKDYVTMNFFGLARVIDYIGGITLDVDEKERADLNKNIFPEMRYLGEKCPDIEKAGLQKLNGIQAVCYARIRKIDGDIERGNRQKEVLLAMFEEVKSMNILKLPTVVEMVLGECETSLSANDIISLATWALVSSPEIEQLSLPNENVPSGGKTINGVWYYVYDTNLAKKELHDFIFEENYYSPEEVAKRNGEDEASDKE